MCIDCFKRCYYDNSDSKWNNYKKIKKYELDNMKWKIENDRRLLSKCPICLENKMIIYL
jgi:hypothetical protein